MGLEVELEVGLEVELGGGARSGARGRVHMKPTPYSHGIHMNPT